MGAALSTPGETPTGSQIPDVFRDPTLKRDDSVQEEAVRNRPMEPVVIPMVSEDESVYDVATKMAEETGSGGEKATEGAATGATLDLKKYARFRTEMFAYMLAESAYDYAEVLYKKYPDDPTIMAFLTETVWLYEKKKNIKMKSHWVDRMDLLQRGIDVSRRCMEMNPDFTPCHKNYTLLALKMADSAYFSRWKASLGNVENYEGIMKAGNNALRLAEYKDFELAIALAELNGRVATKWYSPYRWYGKYLYDIPDKKECIARSKYYHFLAEGIKPGDCENGVRLAMLYYEQGQYAKSRRWYSKVRDGITPTDQRDEFMQNIAHTHLCTRFSKSKWSFFKLAGGDATL